LSDNKVRSKNSHGEKQMTGGTVEPGYERVRDAFADAQAKDEGGAQLCVYRHGKRVVDIWAGMDKANNRPSPPTRSWF
jgi:CubicO group peptidase (beta-lactamase class C family)